VVHLPRRWLPAWLCGHSTTGHGHDVPVECFLHAVIDLSSVYHVPVMCMIRLSCLSSLSSACLVYHVHHLHHVYHVYHAHHLPVMSIICLSSAFHVPVMSIMWVSCLSSACHLRVMAIMCPSLSPACHTTAGHADHVHVTPHTLSSAHHTHTNTQLKREVH